MDLGLAGRCVVLCGDDAVLTACAEALAAEGAPAAASPEGGDIVVAAATRRPGSQLLTADEAGLYDAWADVTRAVDAYHAALPRMLGRGWGRFVWIGSAQARSVDADDDELAAVTTLGLQGLHKVLTAESADRGVTANTVLRGGPAGDDDIAAAVAFLCSTGAAYLSGVTLTVDAGVGSGVF